MGKVSQAVMERIYSELKTPYKIGAVIKTDGCYTDSPVVFKSKGKYYMTYVRIDDKCKTGYCTCLAESDDLIKWKNLGEILVGTGTDSWDSVQSGGYAQFIDVNFGENKINKIDGKYVVAYIGGNKSGYETDPLSMGIAVSEDIKDKNKFVRLSRPVLSGSDADARSGETLTVYKADMFIDDALTLGHKYVCAYNAKDKTNRESIFLAVSDDALKWKRYGKNAVIDVKKCDENIRINGDPQIIKIDEFYVMVYFIYDGKNAYNTFAVSDDLVNWVKWQGEPLVSSSETWDNVFAHKSWVVKENGVVYHYYCAVNDKNERFIAVATSKILTEN